MIPLMSDTARSWLASVEGMPPDQIQQQAVTAAQTGLLSFADALAIKAMADRVSNAAMGVPAAGNVMSDMQQQIQAAIGGQQPAAPPEQMMAGGGVVAFQTGGPSDPRARRSGPQIYGAPTAGRGGIRTGSADFAEAALRQLSGAGTPYRTRGPAPAAAPAAGLGVLGTLGAFFGSSEAAPAAPSSPPAPIPGLGGAPFPLPPPPPPPAAEEPAAGLGSLFNPLITAAREARLAPPDLAKEEEAAAQRYKGLRELLDAQDKKLEERGATLNERADSQGRLLHAMLGFGMAERASQPGATFFGSLAGAGSEYAKNRMALNEQIAERADKLADSRLELERASSQLSMDQSESAYARYNQAQDLYQKREDAYQNILLAQANAEAEQNTALSAAAIKAATEAGKGNIELTKAELAAVEAAMQDPIMPMIQQQLQGLQATAAERGLTSDESKLYQGLLEQRDVIISQYTAPLRRGASGSSGLRLTYDPATRGLR